MRASFLAFFFFALLLLGISSCSFFGGGFDVEEFRPLSNFKAQDKTLWVDLSDAVYRGIEIPAVKQVDGGKFVFQFKINRSGNKKLFYKIYYQNESYKQTEYEEKNGFKYESEKAEQNFYGSWEDTIAFKPVPDGDISLLTDSFRIVGNPRNEKIYFGAEDKSGLNDAEINAVMSNIRKDALWMEQVKRKAAVNNVSEDDQLYNDALWQLNDQRHQGDVNHRWKRNPRTGKYKFMLVVVNEAGLNELPESVKNICKTERNGRYINPFYYYVFGPGSASKNMHVQTSDEELIVKAKFDPGAGVYVSPYEYKTFGKDSLFNSLSCGTDSLLYRKAQFAQFFHHLDQGLILPTVPVVADVTGENYTREQYEANAKTYWDSGRVQDRFQITDCPCKTVSSDPAKHTISIMNPGNEPNSFRKENVGVKTRIGFTYGKFRAKVGFPELLSEAHIWNGLTNAVWLLYQDEAGWNARQPCAGGFFPKDAHDRDDAKRKSRLNYSEIDFEIIKSSRNWPASSYGKDKIPADDHADQNDEIMVACTNWDLSCRDPETDVAGVYPLFFEKNRFELHRWHDWYQALTLKTPVLDNDLYKRAYYWYEIEWTPEHIIWRIGPEKNQMRVVGYMNRTLTTIPDNQMILVVTQEFHDSEWWTPAPFDQRFIPFPKKSLQGKIYEVEVE